MTYGCWWYRDTRDDILLKQDEHLRVFAKIEAGCEFFVSQCVYDLMAAKRFLDDYLSYGKRA